MRQRGSTRDSRTTFVTERQAIVHALYQRSGSMSEVGRLLGVQPEVVREKLVQYQRNTLRDLGFHPPPLRAMLKGDVVARFETQRQALAGRPAMHQPVDPMIRRPPPPPPPATPVPPSAADPCLPARRTMHATASGTTRLILTSAEPEARVHAGFLRNLKAYATHAGAELAILPCASGRRPLDPTILPLVEHRPIDVCGEVSVSSRNDLALRSARPLSGTRANSGAVWTVFAHPVVQLETLPRVRAAGLRVALTTGSCTLPVADAQDGPRRDVAAVVIETGVDGATHCRHLTSPIDGDGSFQDLTNRFADGHLTGGCRVEALNVGDVHHAHLDHDLASATWGDSGNDGGGAALVDLLRPRWQVFHDLVDFDSRSGWDKDDHHRRFAQHALGGGNVEAELRSAAAFLERSRRSWSRSIVVPSNHDARLSRWLRESDFRDDPENAVFYLEQTLALLRRLQRGGDVDGFFETTLRKLSSDGLRGVRFLKLGDSFKIAGIETAIHGDLGPDGGKGGMKTVESLGIRATIGHSHRPTTREGMLAAGVCQTELRYARGPLTSWAAGHVVTYSDGGRQHLFFNGGRFHA